MMEKLRDISDSRYVTGDGTWFIYLYVPGYFKTVTKKSNNPHIPLEKYANIYATDICDATSL